MTDGTITRDAVRGCLLGGAIGDALGANIEFASMEAIRRAHGPDGVTGYVEGDFPRGAFTDDTQMTLFTAEGVIEALRQLQAGEDVDVPDVLRVAYLRWLVTQDSSATGDPALLGSGRLVHEESLHVRRAPGSTCLSALRAGGEGRIDDPINDSKGCGALMRSAPFGVLDSDDEAFRWAAEGGALTHGHPSGSLAAGAFAVVVRTLLRGGRLDDGVDRARALLVQWPDHHEVLAAIDAASELARAAPPDADAIERLGEGWVAEEALAIALYAALATDDAEGALLLAVNHGGDSDSTGAVCGNLVGARDGESALPAPLLEDLQGREIIERMADELHEND